MPPESTHTHPDHMPETADKHTPTATGEGLADKFAVAHLSAILYYAQNLTRLAQTGPFRELRQI